MLGVKLQLHFLDNPPSPRLPLGPIPNGVYSYSPLQSPSYNPPPPVQHMTYPFLAYVITPTQSHPHPYSHPHIQFSTGEHPHGCISAYLTHSQPT